MSRPGAFASALVAAALAGGCTTVTPIDVGGTDPVGGWNAETRRFAVENWLYAQLAINAYNDHEAFILPGNIVERAPSENGENGVGYAYAVYDRTANGETVETIIAYRGTESMQDVLHGGVLGNQHNRGEATAITVGRQLRQSGDDTLIFSLTGHSLGGGIAYEVSAQPLGEDAAGIGRMVAFNSAPRFSPLDDDIERRSIAERGDWLGFLRQFGERPAESHSIDCQPGFDPARDHSMRKLAECLTWIAAYDDEAARLSLAQNPIFGAPPVQTDPREPEAAAGLQGTGVPVNVYTDSPEMRIALDAALLASADLARYDSDRTGYRLHVDETQTAQIFVVEWIRNSIVVQSGVDDEPVSRPVDCRSLSLSECAEEIIAPAERLIAFQLANVACRDLPRVPLPPANRERCGLGALPGLPDGT